MKVRFNKQWARVVLGPKLAWNIMWSVLDSNMHGQGFEIRRGPCFHYCRLDVHAPSKGHRIWFYFPNGRCWNVDFIVDRRAHV